MVCIGAPQLESSRWAYTPGTSMSLGLCCRHCTVMHHPCFTMIAIAMGSQFGAVSRVIFLFGEGATTWSLSDHLGILEDLPFSEKVTRCRSEHPETCKEKQLHMLHTRHTPSFSAPVHANYGAKSLDSRIGT